MGAPLLALDTVYGLWVEPAGQEDRARRMAGGAGDCTEVLHWMTLLLDPVGKCYDTKNQTL